MATERRVTATSGSGKVALTAGDLRAFLAELDAAGAADATPMQGRIGWRGARLTSITADVVRPGDGEPLAGS